MCAGHRADVPRLVENGFYPANPHPGFEKSLAIIAKKNADFTSLSLSLSFLDLLCFFLHFKAHSYRSARPSGKFRWEGARPDAGRDEAVEIAWGNFAGRERDSTLDGEETVQI